MYPSEIGLKFYILLANGFICLSFKDQTSSKTPNCIDHMHKLWYHRRFTLWVYSIVYHTSNILGVDYDIINTDLWYHSCRVSYIYHIKYLRCYIIRKHYDITAVHQYRNLMWYHILNIICDIGCQIWNSVPFGPSNWIWRCTQGGS